MLKMMVPAAVAVLAALAATNPTSDDHAGRMVEHARQQCGGPELRRMMCGGMVALASPTLAYSDHLLFSTARLGETATLGVLGRVMVTR